MTLERSWIAIFLLSVAQYVVIADKNMPIDTSSNLHIQDSRKSSTELETPPPVEIHVNSFEEICRLENIPPKACACVFEQPTCNASDAGTKTNKTFHIEIIRPPQQEDPFPLLSLIYASLTMVCTAVGIAGNSAVLIVAYRQKKQTTNHQILIARLAFVDLLFCVIHFFDVVYLFFRRTWPYGLALCKTIRSVELTSTLMSIGFILIITIERYLGILHPLERIFDEFNLSNRLLLVNIATALATVAPYFWNVRVDPDTQRCTEKWEEGKTASLSYQWFMILFYFTAPITVITTLYYKVIKHLNSKALDVLEIASNYHFQKQREKANRRIMYIVIGTMIAFTVCTLPNKAIWIYLVTVDSKVSRNLYTFLVYVAYLTPPIRTTLNPIIYSAIDRIWRRQILTVLCSAKEKQIKEDTSKVEMKTASTLGN